MNKKQVEDATVSAPLFVTIGPPCSGKTTWLKQKKKQGQQSPEDPEASFSSLLDISLDDQPNVYVPIPLMCFCCNQEEELNELDDEIQELLKRNCFGRTIRERILAEDQQELRWVVQRLTNRISAEQFESSLRSLLQAKENTPNGLGSSIDTKATQDAEFVLKTLVDSTESIMEESPPELPFTVNLFVVEALFQGRITGIERATNLLRQAPKSAALAWGNTNTKSRDYVAALQVAEKSSRPIHFCVYGDNNDHSESLFDLPKLEFRQLVDRNLQRLISKGQYIPCNTIMGLKSRVEKLISDAISGYAAGNQTITKFDLDRGLARLAGFDLQSDRRVLKTHNNRVNGQSNHQWQNRNTGNRGRGYQGRGPARGYRGRGYHQQGPAYQGRASNGPPRQHFADYQPGRDEGKGYTSTGYRQPHGQTNNNFNQPNDHLRNSGYQGRDYRNGYRNGQGRDYRNGYDRNVQQGRGPRGSNYNKNTSGKYNGYGRQNGYAPRNDGYAPRDDQPWRGVTSRDRYGQPKFSNLDEGGDASSLKRQREVGYEAWDDVGDASRYPRNQQGNQHSQDSSQQPNNINADYHG